MNFIILDLSLLAIFLISISILLYKNKKNLVQDGPLYLYKAQWGINLIKNVGKKYSNFLKKISYVSMGVGYVLMAGIVFLILQTVYLYLTTPIARAIKAPPIMPLIPYFPKLFGLSSMFPPFYFIYFILALIIVATVHEFSHGIFAKAFGIRIKTTGFAFFKYFPALFGAFVEQDEKQMNKQSRFAKMSVISAGVFANVLTGFLFFGLLILTFSLSFSASGVVFDTYSYSAVKISNISSVNGISIADSNYDNILDLLEENKTNNVSIGDVNYLTTIEFFEKQKEYNGSAILYHDSPALNAGLYGAIHKIDGEIINNRDTLKKILNEKNIGDVITITSIDDDKKEIETEIVLGEHPEEEGRTWIGIGFMEKNTEGFRGKIYSFFSSFKDSSIYYTPDYEVSYFIYHLLWWIVLINFAVALFNMLPVGILDGGMFFYLTLEGLTKSEKFSKKAFSFMNWFFLLLFVTLMVRWVFIFF